MAKNFKSNKAYKSWLAYGHASGEFAKTPGNQKVSIKGNPKKVKHAHGGPKYPSAPYYPYKGSTLRVNKSYDKNHVQPSVFNHGGPHIDPTALEAANANINTANTSANNYFSNPDNFAATQKMLNEYANVGNYNPTTYSGGFTNTGNTVYGGYNSPVNQTNTLTGGEFYNNEKITDLPIVSYNDFTDKKGQHFYVPNYGIKTPTAPIDRNLATETAQRPVMQNVPLKTNKRKSKIGGVNNKYMKNVGTKHFQTQALDEQGNPMMEDYSIFKQGDKIINERTYNTALRNQQAEQTKYESDLLKTQELINQYKTYGGSIKKKYPNGGNDKTVPSWINKSITSRPNYVEKLPTQEELDKIKYTKDYTPTFKQQVLIDKGLLSYKDAYKGEGEKTKAAWNKYSDPLNREQINKLYSKEDAIKLGLRREGIENLDASTMNTLQKLSPLPNNMNELIGAEIIGDARLNNESLNNEEKILLYNNIQNAIKRTGNPERGGIEYADYGNQGYGSPEQFEDWFVNNNIGPQNLKSNLINTALSAFNPVPGSTVKALYATAKDIATPLTNSYTNPGFNLASTIGRGKYWQDEKDPGTYYYTDRYDWGKGAGGNKGNSFFQKGLDYLRDTESSNTKNTEVDKRKIQFKLTKAEIDKLIAERDASAQAMGGYMKYADGGTILPPNEMPNVNSLSVPPLSEQIIGLSPEAIGDVPPINPSPATAKVGASSIPNDFAFPGKFYNAENLTKWREQMTKDFTNPTTKRKYTEIDPAVSDSLQTLFSNTGYKEDSNIFKDKEGKKFDNPYAKVAWSAATTSNAVMNLFNQDKEGIKKLGFRPAISHSNYITDALLASKDSDYKYNLYNAEPISNTELGVGDILFRGRNTTKDWTFEDFQNNAEKNKDSTKKGKYKGYESHSDIITDKGEDDKGNYYLITGGNLGNTFKNKKVYYNPETGKLKNSNYKGVMRLREEARPQELAPMQNIPMQNIPTENMRGDILNPMEISRNSLASILPNNQFNMGGYMKYANGAELETDPPFTKEQFQTAMGSADMSLGVKPLNRSEQYQYYTGKPYKGDRTSFDRGMTALATTGIGAGIGAGRTLLDYKNNIRPAARKQYDEYIADMNAMGSSWADPNKQMSFDEYLDFYESGDLGWKKEKILQVGAGALAGSIPGFLSNFLVNRGLDAVRMNKNRKHREALENAKALGEPTNKEILEFRNQQKHGGYMQYANGGQFDTGGQMGEFSGVPVTEFNNGGSHEANPLGGIPQGPGALVEEGELKLDLPSGEQFIVSPKIMYKKNDKEVAAIAQELGISEKEFKKFAGKNMVSVFKSLTRKNSFNGEKREGDTIQENSIEADIMPFVELHTFLTERKNAEEAAKKEQAFAQDMDMMMQEHPEYMQAMMAQQQQQQGPSPEEQAMMEQQMMQQQGGAPQGMPPMMGTYGGMLEYKNGGLWANIHAKRARIKAGSGEKMRKPGSKGAPTAQALKNSQTYGGKMNPDKSVIHFNNGGYSYSDYLAPQQAMPVQGVAASGYGQGGMMPKQYKYGAGLGIASDVLGGAASVVGNIPGIGTALGAGLGTLAGTAGYLSDNAAASEDGKVSDIDPAQLALKAGMGAGAGALGFAGATAVNLGGAAVDQFTDSKEDEKNAKTALILQDPTHPEHEKAKARELEKQKALKGTGAIGAGIGLASNIIGGKVDAKNAAGVADADFLESGANLADWAPENTTTAIDATTGLASSMAPPQMAQGGYMEYMHGGAIKYPTGGSVDVKGLFNSIEAMKNPNWESIKNNLKQMNPNIGEDELNIMTTKFISNPELMNSYPFASQELIDNSPNSNINLEDLPKGDVEKQDSVLNLQSNPFGSSNPKDSKSEMTLMDDENPTLSQKVIDKIQNIEDFDSDAAEEAELDAQTEAEMFANAPKVTRKPDLTYKNPDTLKYNTRETNYLKPTFLENVLAASPGIANIGMGLSKADKLKLDRVDPISAKYINLDESRKANERLLAAQQAATKNVAGNAGGGNYLANMQATYLKYLQGMSGIDQQEQNANAQIGNQTAAQNARIAAQNSQIGFREQDYDARTKAAKQNMIGTGIGQIADVYQGNRQNKFLAENYFPLVAPNYSDYYKYETKAGAKRRAKKNS